MSHAPLVIVNRGRTIVVRGNAKLVLSDGGFKGIYAGTVRGWILDGHRLADLCAYLEGRHIAYRITEQSDAA